MPSIYNRTIKVTRPAVPSAVGTVSYGGMQPVTETVVAQNIPASIQYERVGRSSAANLPTDARKSTWMVIIPISALPLLGTVTEADIITDELGKRYEVYAADYQILGYTLHVELDTV